jgi:hypothetical protein
VLGSPFSHVAGKSSFASLKGLVPIITRCEILKRLWTDRGHMEA